jgi:hypothetical protein
LLAARLLKKELLPLGSGTQTKKDGNLSGEPKETAISREIMPADGSSPAQRMNGDFRHVPAYDRQT